MICRGISDTRYEYRDSRAGMPGKGIAEMAAPPT